MSGPDFLLRALHPAQQLMRGCAGLMGHAAEPNGVRFQRANAPPGALLAEMRSGLAVISLTTEGDPIVAFYRTAADTSAVEKFTDRV